MTRPFRPNEILVQSEPSRLRVPVVNETARPVAVAKLRGVARAVFLAHGQLRGTVCLLVSDCDRLQELNRQFRGLDEPTDVLTFPPPENLKSHLGDIAVNREMAHEAGKRTGWSETAELGQLVAHGCLHLLGYQDDDEAGRVHMVQTANEVLARLGMPTDPDWRSLEH